MGNRSLLKLRDISEGKYAGNFLYLLQVKRILEQLQAKGSIFDSIK